MTPEQRARLDAVRDGFARVMTRAQYELMNGDIIALLAAYDAAHAELARLTTPRPFAEWHDDDGTALWWRDGAPYLVGTASDWVEALLWTPIPNPRFPR